MPMPAWHWKASAASDGRSPSGTVTAPSDQHQLFGCPGLTGQEATLRPAGPCHRRSSGGPAISAGLEKGPQAGLAAYDRRSPAPLPGAELVGRLRKLGRPGGQFLSTPRGRVAIGTSP